MAESTNNMNNVVDRHSDSDPKYYEIGQGTGVLNGLYRGRNGDETIVVDYDNRTADYDALADRALNRAIGYQDTDDYQRVLADVCTFVGNTIHYSDEGLLHVNMFYGINEHTITSLSIYIDEGVGVSRHQALLTATIIEILHNRGILNGLASVEHNNEWKENGENGGHAWVRYTDSIGSVFVLDVAKNFFGTLEESQERDDGWNYLHPEDLGDKTHR